MGDFLLLVGGEITPHVAFEAGQLRQAVAQIAAQIRRPAQAGSQVGNVTIAPRPGGCGCGADVGCAAAGVARGEMAPGQPLVAPVAATDPTARKCSATRSDQPADVAAAAHVADSKFGLGWPLIPAS
ncbi:MAG: hypothetical protein R2911_09425 [Caldilineaceae bacterium]